MKISPVLKSYLRSFVAVVLGLFLADGADLFSVTASDLRTWLAAGIAAIIPPALRWLDPNDGAFGRGASE